MYLWNSNNSQSKYEEPYTTSNACDLKKRKAMNMNNNIWDACDMSTLLDPVIRPCCLQDYNPVLIWYEAPRVNDVEPMTPFINKKWMFNFYKNFKQDL